MACIRISIMKSIFRKSIARQALPRLAGSPLQISEMVHDVLADKTFDADWAARLPYRFHKAGRNDLLGCLVSGARVLHLGCADHASLIASKRDTGVWLHDLVMAKAQTAWGVDINADAIEMASGLGVANLHTADVHGSEMPALVARLRPDMLLLPDVLEHLQEPVAFLSRLAELAPQAQLVVSAPNGLSLRNQIQALRGIERINTDHLCWYSPFTILKVLRRGGYRPEALWACQISPARSWAGRTLASLASSRPVWADNLVVVARAIHAASAAQAQGPCGLDRQACGHPDAQTPEVIGQGPPQ